MALRPCRECGKQISASAKTCPSCGVKRPVKSTSPLTWGVLVLLLLGIVSLAASRDNSDSPASSSPNQAPAPTAASLDSTPGITRVGKARAARMWRQVPTTPGMRSRSCAYETCQIMFDPALWNQMPYDQKKDFTAMMGIALAYGQHSKWTEIRDLLTNKRLARYSTQNDAVDID